MDPPQKNSSPPLATRLCLFRVVVLGNEFHHFYYSIGVYHYPKGTTGTTRVNIPLGSKTRPRVVYLSGIPLGALEGGNPPVISCVGKPLSRWLKV